MTKSPFEEEEEWIAAGYTLDPMPAGPFRFVYVKDDGSVRELTDDEKVYLRVRFSGGDGARPYIKTSYDMLTSDGKLRGYLYREMVPDGVRITNS
jgi:hypothetical protein